MQKGGVVLAVRLDIPVACWRKGYARELLETEELPPPATCYGAMLAMVGESDRLRHRGVRMTVGMIGKPEKSTVVRTTWRVKSVKTSPGNGENAKPDFQQLITGAAVIVWIESSGESVRPTLEDRVRDAFRNPSSVDRFGGWSLGESTHLINDARILESNDPPEDCRVFLVEKNGALTLPVWVDHIGTAGTRYAVGSFRQVQRSPLCEELAEIAQ